jgi:hypothetical protein
MISILRRMRNSGRNTTFHMEWDRHGNVLMDVILDATKVVTEDAMHLTYCMISRID